MKNKSIYFISILILTIIITRIITLYVINPDIIISGIELHHFYYGIILLIITSIIWTFKKKQLEVICLTLYSISLGLIIDEFEYVLSGFGNTEIYSATLPSVILLTSVTILITLYIKYKK